MRVAVIGSGISGLIAAWRLSAEHDVVLFEAADYPGGHTHTHDVELDAEQLTIDTGFIVFNRRTYPRFDAVLNELGVASKPTTMSFSVADPAADMEYSSATSGLFAQRRNLVRPRFWRMLAEKIRFDRLAKRLLQDDPQLLKQCTLQEFLDEHGFSDAFARWYILPMTAAVWSAPLEGIGAYPMYSLLRFLANHGLLGITEAPTWRVVEGGSRRYVEAMLAKFSGELRLSTAVESVRRGTQGVSIRANGQTEQYDRVVFACHSDQALALLDDPSGAEKEVLGAMEYQANEAVLHTDTGLLPRHKGAWASWNYWIPDDGTEAATLTYNMNILQGLSSNKTWCVTLNQTAKIDPDRIVKHINYAHPVFDQGAIAAQQRWDEISSHSNQTFYCGAYWFYGFHEDGVRSALRVVDAFETAQQAIDLDEAA